MTVLTWIIIATLLGGALSVVAAAVFALNAKVTQIPVLISYAVGALLGAVFLDILPHAFGMSDSMETMAGTILFGILLFFVLEKLVLWRHCHQESCEAHDPPAPVHDYGRSGMMIMIGDTFHNFVDGVLIAAAFLASVELGIVTAIAIIAHEVPQEVGDFLILLHSGYSKAQALMLNMLSSAAMIAGGVLAYLALHTMEQWIPPLLGLAAASMLYVSVADLIPGLHRRPEIHATVQQVVLIALGVATIWLVGEFAHSHA
ncbi:MAG: ZIP family metal transporter [Betaproteobacteria bacterium]|nr:ZIP family metal transporter [Betaproteobacteria bacterium]